MTATATLRRSRPSLAATLKRAPGEALVFAGATILALIHAFDDALVSRQPGVPSDRHALALSIALFLGVAAIAGFTRLRPGLRAGLAFAFGGLATVNGAMHTIHAANHGADAGDVTGVLAAAAGLVLVGLAVAIPWRHRGERPTGARARSSCRRCSSSRCSVSSRSGWGSSRCTSGASRSASRPARPIRTSTFQSSDGLRLAGWYCCRATAPRSRSCTAAAATAPPRPRTRALLARDPDGVRSTTSSGRGESEGAPNSYGWGWEKDAAGARQVPQGARGPDRRPRALQRR